MMYDAGLSYILILSQSVISSILVNQVNQSFRKHMADCRKLSEPKLVGEGEGRGMIIRSSVVRGYWAG